MAVGPIKVGHLLDLGSAFQETCTADDDKSITDKSRRYALLASLFALLLIQRRHPANA